MLLAAAPPSFLNTPSLPPLFKISAYSPGLFGKYSFAESIALLDVFRITFMDWFGEWAQIFRLNCQRLVGGAHA